LGVNFHQNMESLLPVAAKLGSVYWNSKRSNEAIEDMATLAKATYTSSDVSGFQKLNDFSSPDRTVYQRHNDGKVFISFRGTDTSDFFQDPEEYQWHDQPTSYMKHAAKAMWESRAFRDVSTDAMLALGLPKSSLNRFRNAERVTKTLIDTYGKQNVVAVGHSLGGSQALHVSNKYSIEAHAIKPHITYSEFSQNQEFNNAYIYYNLTDPVSLFAPFTKAKGSFAGFDTSLREGLEQHSVYPSQRFEGLPQALWNNWRGTQLQWEKRKSAARASLAEYMEKKKKAPTITKKTAPKRKKRPEVAYAIM